MNKERQESVEKILREEGNRYKERLEELRRILRDLKEKHCNSYLPREIKKYVNRKKVKADIRLCMQVIADVSEILIVIKEEDSKAVDLLGGMYDGELYPEILEILKKADLKCDDEEGYVVFR